MLACGSFSFPFFQPHFFPLPWLKQRMSWRQRCTAAVYYQLHVFRIRRHYNQNHKKVMCSSSMVHLNISYPTQSSCLSVDFLYTLIEEIIGKTASAAIECQS